MSDLTGQEIKETYKDLLHMNNGNTGVTSDLSRVFDGEGTGSSLYLSDTEASVMGDVGIGTTSPESLLHISGGDSDSRNITLQYEGTSAYEEQGIIWKDFRGQINAQITNILHGDGIDAPAANLDFRVGDGTSSLRDAMTIKANGHVGIGTTTPEVLLHVENSSTSTYSPTSIVSSSAKLARFRTRNNSATDLQTASINLISSGNNGTSNAEIALNCIQETDTSAGAIFTVQQRKSDRSFHETLRIDSEGNVGIGTTSPESELHVNGDIILSGETSGNQGTRAKIVHTSGTAANGEDSKNDGGLILQSNDNSTYVDALTIDHSGQVGIGTTSPQAPLEIKGARPAIRLNDDDPAGQSNFEIVNNGGGFGIFDAANNSLGNLLHINGGGLGAESGNVGIGTTSPSAKLEIVETSSGTQFQVKGTEAIGGQFQVNNAGGDIYSNYRGAGSNDDVVKIHTNGDTFFNGGNVGIGTTSPIFKLDVLDHTSLSLGANDNNERSNLTNKSSRVGGVHYNNQRSPVNMMMHYSTETENRLYFGWGTSAMVCPTKIVFGTASTNNISSAFSSTNQRMIIDGSGNVEIKKDLDVGGTLSKSLGNFKIDHPLPEKSETHHLIHSFIEGPQADNIYRGKVELVAGKAQVNIDSVSGMTEGTFVALNRDIQAFTSNESDWDAVRGKVEGNKLIIECQNAGSTATVSWLVIGERQDEHMFKSESTDENGKLIVEPLKPEPEPEYEMVEPEEVVAEEPVAEEAPVEQVAEEAPVSIGASISGESLTEVSEARAEEL